MTDSAALVTHVGRVRAVNEDSVMVADDLWVVADGLGGHEGGEHASRVAVETVVELTVPAEGADSLVRAIEAAHHRIVQRGRELGVPAMGTTVVAAARHTDRSEVTVAWVGDSRAYLLDDRSLRPVTEDHNEAAELLRKGYLSAQDARVSPAQAWLTRSLGAGHPDVPAVDTVTVPARGRLLLCSDGLTAELDDDRIGELLAEGDPEAACAALLQAALDAGGSDNVTLVVVDLRTD
jgi:PPM family protein phosphatase